MSKTSCACAKTTEKMDKVQLYFQWLKEKLANRYFFSMSDEESRSAHKRMWKITSGVLIVFFLRPWQTRTHALLRTHCCRHKCFYGGLLGPSKVPFFFYFDSYMIDTYNWKKVKDDHRSKFSNLSNWKEEAWKKKKKKSGLQRDSNPWPPRYRCDALPTAL